MKALIGLLAASIALTSYPVLDWDRFEKAVRDQTIAKEEAEKLFPDLYTNLKQYCRKYEFEKREKWIFPLENYYQTCVAKDCFIKEGYNFYNGNKASGHPALDMLINDKNKDSIDDNTSEHVNVVCPVDMLIISVCIDWDKKSDLKGGKYIWGFNPEMDTFFYFAQLVDVLVMRDTLCKAGEVIGKVGRTGRYASQKSSSTNLHFMVLKVVGNSLVPFNCLEKFPRK